MRERVNSPVMNINVQGDLLTAILAFAMALSVILRGRRSRQQIIFAVLAVNLCCFHLCGFLYQLDSTYIWQRGQYALAATIPLTATMLVATFLPEGQALGRGLYSLEYTLTPMFIIAVMSPLYARPGFPLVLGAYVYLTLLMAYSGLIQGRLRAVAGPDKRRLLYILAGGVAVIMLEVPANMDLTRPYLKSAGDAALVLYLYF
ncbi:MAG: hypothetical protein WC889_14765, partial [Myxococcota bacterium]